jgi:hypothetical protein
MGDDAPDTVKLAPVSETLLIVTAAVPVEVTVIDCDVAAVFT